MFQLKRYAFISDIWVFSAVILTGVNDAWLKGSGLVPGISGKLSDVCGLFFFPFMILEIFLILAELLKISIPPRLIFGWIVLGTSIMFSAIKIIPAVRQTYIRLYANVGINIQIIQDVSDLWALGSCILAMWYFDRILLREVRS